MQQFLKGEETLNTKKLADLIGSKKKVIINGKEETASLRLLGTTIGVTRQTLASIINGLHTPTFATVEKICNFYGVDYHDYI